MTERQLRLLHAAELRRQHRHRAEYLVDANMASIGGRDAEQHRKNLNKLSKQP
mgnify:CR=1 FL=1